jgi:hypothetical protein
VQPISSLVTTLRIAAIFLVLAAAALASFGAGFITNAYVTAAAPAANPAQIATVMQTVEEQLGYAGFLGAQKRFRDSARADDATAMIGYTNEAQRALAKLDRFPAATFRELKAITERFSAAARLTGSGTSSGPDLEPAYQALRQETSRLRQAAVTARLDALSDMSRWAIAAIGSAVGLLVIGFVWVGWALSRSVLTPLRQLQSSLASAGRDMSAGPVWGVERKDEIGAIARGAERLRAAMAESANLPALAQSAPVKIRLDGPSGVIFEKLVSDLGAAATQLESATHAVQSAGGAGREQLTSAAQRLSAVTAELSGFAHGARAEVRDAVEAMRGAASHTQTQGQTAQTHVAQAAQRFQQTGEQMAAAAAEMSGRVTMALAELAASGEGLRMAAQEARANQSAVTAFTQNASGQTAEALGLLNSAGLNLKAALSSMEERMTRAFQSVSRLTEILSSSASALSNSTEDSSRRLAAAAKDMEGRSKEAELRLGLALDQAGQQAKATAAESQALKVALAQALDDLRQTRSGLESMHGAPGADLTHVLSAVQELQSLLVQKAGGPGDTHPDSLENPAMASLRIARPITSSAPRLPIAAADMLARLGSIAAEVRAAAGHDLTGLRAAAEALGPLLAADGPSDWAAHAAMLEAERAQLSETLTGVQSAAAELADGLASEEPKTLDGRARLQPRLNALLREIAEADKFEAPKSIAAPVPVADTLELAARDIQRLSDLIAEMEHRAESLASSAASGMATPTDGVIAADPARADAAANEAIVAVMESIERLNNIAAALSRAGDFQAQRKAGE